MSDKKKNGKRECISKEEAQELLQSETAGIRTCMRNGLKNDIALGKDAENGLMKLDGYANRNDLKKTWLDENMGRQKSSVGDKRRLYRLSTGYFSKEIDRVDPVALAKIPPSLLHHALSKMEARHKTDMGQWNKPGIKLIGIEFQTDKLILSFDHTDKKYNLAELKVAELKALAKGEHIRNKTPGKCKSNKNLLEILMDLKKEHDRALQYISEKGHDEFRAKPIPGLESVLDTGDQEGEPAEPKVNEEAQHLDAVPTKGEEVPSAIQNAEVHSEQNQDDFEIEDDVEDDYDASEAEASTPTQRRALPSPQPPSDGRYRSLAATPEIPSRAAINREASSCLLPS